MKISWKTKVFYSILALAFAPAGQAAAVCPVCTVAVGAGLGLSRWLGIDDAITGLWIGGLLLSVTIWTINWLEGRNIRFRFRGIAIGALYFSLAIIPLYYARIVSSPVDFFCSCFKDSLLLGVFTGSSGFYFGATLYEYLKERNGGHAHFPFEKVAMPIAPLVILSVVFYFLTK